MIFLYGEARGNGRATCRLYQDRFAQRPTLSHTLFAVIPQRLRVRGTFTASSMFQGDELEEAVGTMCATKLLVATSNRTCSGSEVNHHFKRQKQFLSVTINKSGEK